jgi:hypothetical protein
MEKDAKFGPILVFLVGAVTLMTAGYFMVINLLK